MLVTRPRATAGAEPAGAEPALATEHLSILSVSSSNKKLAYKERTESIKNRIFLHAPRRAKKVFYIGFKMMTGKLAINMPRRVYDNAGMLRSSS